MEYEARKDKNSKKSASLYGIAEEHPDVSYTRLLKLQPPLELQATEMRNRNISWVESARDLLENETATRMADHIDARSCQLLSYIETSTLQKYP
jgi:hypothetical protein